MDTFYCEYKMDELEKELNREQAKINKSNSLNLNKIDLKYAGSWFKNSPQIII